MKQIILFTPYDYRGIVKKKQTFLLDDGESVTLHSTGATETVLNSGDVISPGELRNGRFLVGQYESIPQPEGATLGIDAENGLMYWVPA